MNSGQIRQKALNKITGKFGVMVGITIISKLLQGVVTGSYPLVNDNISKILGQGASIVGSFVTAMLVIGALRAALLISRDGTPKLEELFFAFQNVNRFAPIALVYTLIDIVLSIPMWFFNDKYAIIYAIGAGIISVLITFRIALSRFLMIDNERMTAKEALEKSSELMKGHCMELFGLYLSYIGWYILGGMSCGIGLLWIEPWVDVAVAIFYLNRIKNI